MGTQTSSQFLNLKPSCTTQPRNRTLRADLKTRSAPGFTQHTFTFTHLLEAGREPPAMSGAIVTSHLVAARASVGVFQFLDDAPLGQHPRPWDF